MEKGYQVTLEARRKNRGVDLLVVKPPKDGTRASENMAIETAKGDLVGNVSLDLIMGQKVVEGAGALRS